MPRQACARVRPKSVAHISPECSTGDQFTCEFAATTITRALSPQSYRLEWQLPGGLKSQRARRQASDLSLENSCTTTHAARRPGASRRSVPLARELSWRTSDCAKRRTCTLGSHHAQRGLRGTFAPAAASASDSPCALRKAQSATQSANGRRRSCGAAGRINCNPRLVFGSRASRG